MRRKNEKAPKTKPALTSPRLLIYDSIAQCSAAECIPVAVLRFAKKNGCLAFDHGRVHVLKFNEWYFGQNESGKNWDDEFKEWRAKRERQKYQIQDGKLIRADDAVSAGSAMWGVLQKIFGQKLPSELPARLRGLDELRIRKLLQDTYQDGLKECDSEFKATIEKAKKRVEESAMDS